MKKLNLLSWITSRSFGDTLVLLAIALFIIAWNTQSGYTYLVASVLSGLLLLDYIWTRFATNLELQIPRKITLTAYHPGTIPITITSPGGGLWYSWSTQAEVNSFIKIEPISTSKATNFMVIPLPVIGPRGSFSLTKIQVQQFFPLGLFDRPQEFTVDCELEFAPSPYSGKLLELFPYKAFESKEHSTTDHKKGEADFLALRPFQAGDNMKNINWKAFAKTQELYFTERSQEHAPKASVWLDRKTTQQDHFEVMLSIARSLLEQEVCHTLSWLDDHQKVCQVTLKSPWKSKLAQLQPVTDSSLTTEQSSDHSIILTDRPEAFNRQLQSVIINLAKVVAEGQKQ